MKLQLTICLLGLSLAVKSQQLKVTIIGTAHYFKPEYQDIQSFDTARKHIVSISPDIFFIEAIPTHDTLSLREIHGVHMDQANEIRHGLENNYYDSLATRALLKGARYYAHYDFWNAYYQWNTIEEEGDTLGVFSSYQKKLENSEYGTFIFPAARELGVTTFYEMDYRHGEEIFLANNNKVLKELLFKLKWKPLRIYLRIQKQYKKAEQEGKLIEFINGKLFLDSFTSLIDDLPKRLPRSEEAQAIKSYWYSRNEIMADRIISTSFEKKAKKVLVAVGSAHVLAIKQFLEAQGHSVTIYNDLINKLP